VTDVFYRWNLWAGVVKTLKATSGGLSMEFKFETKYDQKAFTTMARTLRKTVRRKRSRKSHVFGWIVVTLALLLVFAGEGGFVLNMKSVLTLAVAAIMILTLIWEDAINGYVALKRTLPGTDRSTCTFYEDGYISVTDMGKTEWSYEKPMMIAESGNYFVFIFSNSHAQLYDKRAISGGTVEEFRAFIEEKTGKKLVEA